MGDEAVRGAVVAVEVSFSCVLNYRGDEELACWP